MADKKETLHQKTSGGAYDTLYVNTTATRTFVSSSINTKLGLTNGNIDQAIARVVSDLKNTGLIHIRVTDNSGVPVVGAVITGLENTVTTGENGEVFGKIGNATSMTVTPPYADFLPKTVSLSTYVSSFSIFIVRLDRIADNTINRYSSSTTLRFSSNVASVDVCCVGGGGAGCGNTSYSQNGGGGGGAIVNSYNIAVTPDTDYPLIVGSGGSYERSVGTSGGSGSSGTGDTGSGEGEKPTNAAADGGETSFMGVIAPGGKGGQPSAGGVAGAEGCGNGGYVANGKASTVAEFDDTSVVPLRYSGGGGGGYSINANLNPPQEIPYYAGGEPNGADGAAVRYIMGREETRAAGVAGIGGGGGGMAVSPASSSTSIRTIIDGSSGGNGLVAVRIHFK
nr:MAG TPA: hypothetical protein [Caudoviricetes sp.]